MKKKTKVIVSSALSMAVCASLIASSTLALFTSESKTNIAITSGKVDVKASAQLTDAWSAEWKDGEDKYENKNLTAGEDGAYTFTNGGTAQYDETSNKLTVNNISPGDGVKFNLMAENSSNISIKYQTVVTFVSGGKTVEGAVNEDDTDISLFQALEISVGEEENMQNVSSNRSTAVSEWTTIEPNATIAPISVTIELPVETGNELQDMSCSLTIGLYAVQANGHDTTHQNTGFTYFVGDGSNLSEVFGEVQSGDTVALNDSFTQSEEEAALEVKDGKDVTLDLNGHDFTVSADISQDGGHNGVAVEKGSKLTLKNEAKTEGEALPKFTLDVNEFHEENGNDPDGNFDLRVDGTLNVEGVEFHIEGKSGETAVFVCGDDASITFDETAELTMTGKGQTDDYVTSSSYGFSDGIIVSSGADVTLNGTTVKTEGAITPFIVGFQNGAEHKSSLTLNGADVTFDGLHNATYRWDTTNVAGLQAYTGGEINITNKSTIKVCGSAEGYGTISGAVALSCVGGGDITFEDSTMELGVSSGLAVAAQTITNYSYTDGVSTGVYLDAHITFKSGTITGTAVSGKSSITLFAAQRNGTQQYFSGTGIVNGDTLALNEDGCCSIIIESDMTIKVNDEDVSSSNGNTFYKGSETAATEKSADLREYTMEAIQDNRVNP